MKNNRNIFLYIRRCITVLPSVPVAALGIILFIHAGYGCDPFTTFEIGLANIFSVPLGTASLIFEGCIFLVFFFIRKDFINFGTAAWCFTIGPFFNFWESILIPALPSTDTLSVFEKIGLIATGTILLTVAIAYYIPVNIGYQAADILAFTAADLLKQSYAVGLTVSYGCLLLGGVLMGAPVGFGTVFATCAFGKIIDVLSKKIGIISLHIAGMAESATD